MRSAFTAEIIPKASVNYSTNTGRAPSRARGRGFLAATFDPDFGSANLNILAAARRGRLRSKRTPPMHCLFAYDDFGRHIFISRVRCKTGALLSRLLRQQPVQAHVRSSRAYLIDSAKSRMRRREDRESRQSRHRSPRQSRIRRNADLCQEQS